MLRPFWRYYGGKWRAAKRYPPPRHGIIFEPFAGSAGYSLRHPERRVILYEKYPVIVGVWRYLIGASEADILAIPCVDNVDELPPGLCQEARWLFGFCMNSASAAPARRLSVGGKWLRENGRNYEGWSDARRTLIASQLSAIRHWEIVEADYDAAPPIPATWFIDPPYEKMGKHYVHSDVDYGRLGAWCRSLPGQVMVCEGEGAQWLPFTPFGTFKAVLGREGSREVIWQNDGP